MPINVSRAGPAVLILGPTAVAGPLGLANVTAPVESRLLAALALAAMKRTGLTAAILNEQVWGGVRRGGDGASYGHVHTAVSRLKKRLKSVGADATITFSSEAYRLRARTDLELAAQLVKQAKARPHDQKGALALLEEAAALWRGEPLEGLDDQLKRDVETVATEIRSEIALSCASVRGELGGASAEIAELRTSLVHAGLCRVPAIHRKLIEVTLDKEGPAVAREAFEDACDRLGYDSKTWPDSFQDLLTRIERMEDQFEGEQGRDFSSAERHAYSNVPGPTYAQFVLRATESGRLRQALESEKPIIAVTSIGGRGKTSLVNHFVRHLPRLDAPRFFAIVWVSDETVPGSTTLTTIVDELAKTVNEPRLSQATPAFKESLVRTYLQSKNVLFIIDNFETITDEAVHHFLAHLPDGSKAIITTIREHPQIARFATRVEVSRPPDGVTVNDYLSSMLESAEITGIGPEDPRLRRIWELADGNLRLVEYCIGLLRRRGFAVVESLLAETRGAGAASSDAIENVLRTSFADLAQDESVLLRATACYPEGASWERIQRVSGLPEARFSTATDEMIGRLLVRDRLIGERAVLRVEPLVARRFSPALDPTYAIEMGITTRWLSEVVRLARGVGFCPDDLSRLAILDDPIEFRNLEYALRWMRANESWEELESTARELYYFYYVRGLWSSDPDPYLLWTLAASKLEDQLSEFNSLIIRANIAAKQKNETACNCLFARLQPLAAALDGEIPPPLMGKYRQALALHALSSLNYKDARRLWEVNLAEDSGVELADYNASLRWYALCLARQGDPAAREWLERSRAHSVEYGFDRALARTNLEIAKFELQDPSSGVALEEILHKLDSLETEITELKDPICLADYLSARAETLRRLGHAPEADVLASKAQTMRRSIPAVGTLGEER